MCKHGKVKTSLNNRFAMCNTYKIVTMNLTLYYFKPINPNLLNGTNNCSDVFSIVFLLIPVAIVLIPEVILPTREFILP